MVTSSFSDSIVFAVHTWKTAFSNSTIFKSFHSGERFRNDPFSERCSVDGSRIRNKTVSFSFENGVVWTGSHTHAMFVVVANLNFKFGALRREKRRGLAFYTRTLCLTVIKPYKQTSKCEQMGTPSYSILQNQIDAPLPAGLSRWCSGIIVEHVTKGSWVRFPLDAELHFFLSDDRLRA